MFLSNNKSAKENGVFVQKEISQLLEKRCISGVNEIPVVVNPLTVVYSR